MLTSLPSLYSCSSWARPRMDMPEAEAPLRLGDTPSSWPLRMTLVCRRPCCWASSAWAHKKLYSPCTGRKWWGLTRRSMSCRSSLRASMDVSSLGLHGACEALRKLHCSCTGSRECWGLTRRSKSCRSPLHASTGPLTCCELSN